MRRALFLAAWVVAVLAITAIGFIGHAAAAEPQTITVSEVEFALNPSTFTVQAGQPVQFTVTNNGKVQHNLTVELPAANLEQKLFATNLQPGETRTVTYTFPQAGQWEIYCPIPGHEDAGMKGTVTVLAAAAPAAANTLASSATTAPSPTGSNSPAGSAPTALPTTGGQVENTIAVLGLAGLVLLAGSFALWKLAGANYE